MNKEKVIRAGVSVLLLLLIVACIAGYRTNKKMLEEFETHILVSGTLEDKYSKSRVRLSRAVKRETTYYFKLKEFDVLFDIGRLTKPAFDWNGFNELPIGVAMELRVDSDFYTTKSRLITPSSIISNGRQYIDPAIRNSERRSNAAWAMFWIFGFSIGLIHHQLSPWI